MRTSPFVDFMAGGASLDERFSHFLVMGVEVGVYLWDLVRVVPQLSVFPGQPDDKAHEELPNGFSPTQSESPAVLWGGSVGVALISDQTFALAPGLMFLRTDRGAYGNFLGVNLPFDWVTDSGARVGFVVAVGRGFGGSVRGTCSSAPSFPAPNPNTDCDPGEIREFNRPGAAGFYSHFHFGWGAGHPKRIQTRAD